jgi:hypothetical protein
MKMDIYQATVPLFLRSLENLKGIIDKGIAFQEEREIAPEVLPNYRLAPDMLPLFAQIDVAGDMARACGARLAGMEVPEWDKSDTHLPALKSRLEKTIAFLEPLKAEQFQGCEEREIVLEFPGITLNFNGMSYVRNYVTPNFYFHMTTAYNILRMAGVAVGKADYLGDITSN